MPVYSSRSGRLSVTSLGHLASCSRACGITTQCKLSVELSKAVRREEAGDHGPDNGVLFTERDYELGVVPADRAHDDEHGTLDACWGVDCRRHGQIDQGAESMSAFVRGCVLGCARFFSYVLCALCDAAVYYSVLANTKRLISLCCHGTRGTAGVPAGSLHDYQNRYVFSTAGK